MIFDVVTLFPEMIQNALSVGIVSQAIKQRKLDVRALSPRVFTSDVHQTVDDRPFGGGDGMIMLAEPLTAALADIRAKDSASGLARRPVIHLSPRGRPLTDARVRELARLPGLILIASRYGGVDERFLKAHVDEEVSIGDYVLSGGELAALVVIDAVARQVPGVLGNETSASDESFAGRGWLEYPQYTRPREWNGLGVPDMLLSGDHAKIARWREAVSLLVTADRRPELLATAGEKERRAAVQLLSAMSTEELRLCGVRGDRDVLLQRLNT